MSAKLVRDKVQQWCGEHGVSGHWFYVKDEELIKALRKKIGEELGEYMEDHDPGELLDLFDVLLELVNLTVSPEDRAVHFHKYRQLGGFRSGLMWDPVPEEHKPYEIR